MAYAHGFRKLSYGPAVARASCKFAVQKQNPACSFRHPALTNAASCCPSFAQSGMCEKSILLQSTMRPSESALARSVSCMFTATATTGTWWYFKYIIL